MNFKLPIAIALLSCSIAGSAQKSPSTFVDKSGTLRWSNDKSEVNLYGVNYTAPFAYCYRAIEKFGLNHEEAIKEDIHHFTRMGINAFRVHVWDTEISDTLGNLIKNEHLRLFDYQVMLLKQKGIKMMLTPIAYWGNGYPEPDEKTPGFSARYTKDGCLTNPLAIKAQANYLAQFLNHVNPYTSIAYKDDPDVVAFEISNEPHHPGDYKDTKNFINTLANAMRKAGCRKPVFYNISHKPELINAYVDANIEGGTFQWYPTGLVFGKELKGNQLPCIDSYRIPYNTNPKFKRLAKVVYEFDAGDVGRSYMYPYMAKSFREAGFQFATQFAYDPMATAFANTEYQTHFLNLAYTPSKAVSMMVAAQAFKHTPRTPKATSYPADSSFGLFRVSYKQDLSEMVTDTTLIYSNTTASKPQNTQSLQRIIGVGSSPVVSYEGTGVYFLEKLDASTWRLEVMPDAVWVRDPFERNSLKKMVSAIIWRNHPISISLPQLGDDFSIKAINQGNTLTSVAGKGSFSVAPGVYLLTKSGEKCAYSGSEKWHNIVLNEYYAPKQNIDDIYVRHTPLAEVAAGKPITVTAQVYSANEPSEVTLYAPAWWHNPKGIAMSKISAYTYSATIPAEMVTEGSLGYYIAVKDGKNAITFPEKIAVTPADHDFYAKQAYNTRVVDSTFPISLFDASKDFENVIFNGPWNSIKKRPTANSNEDYLEVNLDALKNDNNDVSMQFFVGDRIQSRAGDLGYKSALVFKAKSLNNKICTIQIKLIDSEGNAFGKSISVTPMEQEYTVPFADLNRVKAVNLPSGYPDFLNYYFSGNDKASFNLQKVEKLQVSIGPDILKKDYDTKHGIDIRWVQLR